MSAYLETCDPTAIRFHDLDDAILGTDHNGNLVYGYDQLVDCFVQAGMGLDEAGEWVDYNVIGTNGGQGFTVLYT